MKRLVGINDDNSLKWDNLPKNTQKLIIRYTNRRESLLVSHQWNKCITKMKLDWFSILSPNWHLTLEEVILYYEPYSLQISDQPPSYAFKKQLAFLIDNFKCRIKDSLLARRMKEIVEKNLWGFHSGLLAYKNYHPLDFHIYFVDEGHLYHILFYDPSSATYQYATNKDGVKDALRVTSVTTFIDCLFEKFDGDAIVTRMMANTKKWNNPNENKYYGKSKEEILLSWKDNGDQKSGQGSYAHNTIEHYCNERPYDASLKSFQLFLQFEKERVKDKLVPFRTEQYLFNREILMIGAVDALYSYIDPKKQERDAEGKLHIILVDWKCVEKFTMEGFRDRTGKKKTGIQPCTSSLDDCKFSKYSIQLMLYKWMLEEAYDIIVDDMWIIIVHPQQLTYRREIVKWDAKLIFSILKHRKETLLK